MMKKRVCYIISFLQVLLFAGCADEMEQQEPRDVDFVVRVVWQDGLGTATRALSATDILAVGTQDIVIGTGDYPSTINVHCSDGTDFTLDKGLALCADHDEYWQYAARTIYKDKKIERDNLTFAFSATIDGGDVLGGEADKDAISDKTSSGQRHMLVTLHHTKALLRFAFKVSKKYDKVRYIRVTNINLNGSACYVKDAVLNKTNMTLIGYAYIDPAEVTTSYENTIRCTYNIYDKDAVFPIPTMTEVEKTAAETELRKHLTREGVVAQNKFTLGSLKDASSSPVTTIRAGYYYDLHVTLNPDYLYVLSEHDNKHITIN